MLTPVPKIPLDETPAQPFKNRVNKIIFNSGYIFFLKFFSSYVWNNFFRKEFVLPDLNLKTATVLNLFEDVNYDLNKVRFDKTVKPIYFTQFPKDLDEIKSVKLKKETFIKIVLRKGVIYKGRKNIDQFKSAFAVDTKLRSLDEAMKNADVFLGLSAKDVVSKEMVNLN